MTTPPLPGTRRRISSGTLRGWSVTARAPECEKITGASATSSAAAIVAGDTWLRSTSIPSRFISRTTSTPNARQAVVPRLVGGGVGPARRPPVGQGHVAHAAGVELAQRGQRARDHRAALEPDERRDPAGRERALDLVGGRRQREGVRVAPRRTDGRCRAARAAIRQGLELGQRRRDPDRPELAADAARPGAAGCRCRVPRRGRGGRPSRSCSADALAQRDRQVVVAVDQRRVAEDRAGAFDVGIGRFGHALRLAARRPRRGAGIRRDDRAPRASRSSSVAGGDPARGSRRRVARGSGGRPGGRPTGRRSRGPRSGPA